MNKLWNNHMHTEFSGDSTTPMEDMMKASYESSLIGITFTDHLDLDYYHEPHLFDLDIEAYRKCYEKLLLTKPEDFQMLWGIELGLQPHLADNHKEIISKYNFDYIIGSSHQVDKEDPYYPEYFERLGIKEGVRRYFSSIIENINSFKDFDAYGHLDYIMRYSKEAQATLTYRDYGDIVDEILNLLIRNNIALEINTAAYKFGLSEPNPEINIIKRYKELGGNLITLGSDAHVTEHILVGYDKIKDVLLSCGFDEYVIYKNRQPVFLPL